MTGAPFILPDFHDKVAVVTGASRGIGRSLALRLAQAGAAVAVAAKSVESKDSLPGSIHDTVRDIEAVGGSALAVRTNVRDEADIQAMVDRTLERFGRIDFMIHNAGALWWRSVAETPAKRFDLVMEVNARAAFLCAHAVLPHMIERGSGHVLVMSPPVDLRVLPNKVAYMISKFGMTMLAMGLAEEVRAHGVAANALWPATAIESQATIHHQLGTRAQWRKPEILADAACAILARSAADCSGRALIDEEVLRAEGVTDFDVYNCVPGGQPLRIIGDAARAIVWNDRTGSR
ncbi:MAG TPA: SDR family oxidoreductase [Planctomycetota bacterium]